MFYWRIEAPQRAAGSDSTMSKFRTRHKTPRAEPRELISGRAAAGPLAQVQALLALGAAINGAFATLLPHPSYYNVVGLLTVQVSALAYGVTVLVLRDKISFSTLRIGNLLAAVMTTFAVYFSGDSTSGYAIFYLWIGFYV